MFLIPKGAELKGKPKSGVLPAARLGVLDVIISQGVIAKQYFLICRQVEQCRLLAGIHNLSSWQGIGLNEGWQQCPKDGC